MEFQQALVSWFQGLHSASVPGILALDLCPSDTNKVLTGTFTTSFNFKAFVINFHGRYQLQHLLFGINPCIFLGGADKNVVVFDKNEEQIVATLKGHTKKVTSVIYHPSQVTLFLF